MYQVLVLQSQVFDKLKLKQQVYCKTSGDKERIVFAKDYLIQHYDAPPTLTGLAQITGINEFKLKKGFKEIFGTTAFEYLTNYKMEIAKNKLSQKQTTISQLNFMNWVIRRRSILAQPLKTSLVIRQSS